MDDLTGLDESQPISLNSHLNNQAVNQNKVSAGVPSEQNSNLITPDGRRPISRRIELDKQALQLKSFSSVGLDASRRDKKVLPQFSNSTLGRWFNQVTSTINGKKSIEILQVIHLCQEDQDNFINGWIAALKRGDRILGTTIPVQGWLVGKTAQPNAVQIMFNSDLITLAPVNIPRPDVLRVIPFSSGFCHFGFNASVNIEKLPREAKLTLQAIFADKTAVPIGLIHFHKYGF
jgi:hypothetical protein